MIKVLVVATSHKTRGGVTSVVKAHLKGKQWNDYHCKWIETHIDRGFIWKLWYLIKGWLVFMVLLPFCDLVHFHTSEPPSALRKCLFFPFARLWRKKIIVHFHAFSPDTTINSKYKSIYRYLFGGADCVIVLSQLWKQYVNEAFDLGDKVQIIYNPCTTEVLNGTYSKKKQILYAGTVNARKGYADMIKAFAVIARQYPDWSIVFAGNGEVDKGKALAKELDITAQTVFLGWVSGKEKDKAFKEATTFCLPSYAEGFPMAVLDAWAYGLPVITTPVGGIPDIARDGINLLLFNAGDVESLAGAMRRMIDDSSLRMRIQEESVRLAQTTFNMDTINGQIGDLYGRLLQTH